MYIIIFATQLHLMEKLSNKKFLITGGAGLSELIW